MSDADEHDLEAVRADGWFDRVTAGVPALERLCDHLGEALVALSLAAGFRIVSATIDRATNAVSALSWVRDDVGGKEVQGNGSPNALRTEVLATLLGDADPPLSGPIGTTPDALRAYIGQRFVLLAPLFGLTLRRLLAAPGDEPRVVVAHDGIEEIVPLKQLRRFLRARVVDVLQTGRGRAISIDLELAASAREAYAAGRYDEVVGKLASWVAPLMMYHRTPEGASLDPATRADISRALGVLGQTFHKLGRADESEETLRLAVQYAHDSPAAAEMYRTLALTMMDEGRYGEAIGPLRRAVANDPENAEPLVDLALCYVRTQKAVAALGCLRIAREKKLATPSMERAENEVKAALGDALERYERETAATTGSGT